MRNVGLIESVVNTTLNWTDSMIDTLRSIIMEEGQDRIRSTYGENYARPKKVKKTYDPNIFFISIEISFLSRRTSKSYVAFIPNKDLCNMQTYKIRASNPRDAPAIEEMLKASYPTLMAVAYDQAVLDPVLQLITKANFSLLSSGTYYVAEAGDALIVGCGGWTIDKPPGVEDVGSEVGHLRHFGTHPDWTRRGIGRAIFRRCESTARSANVKALEVCSSLNAEEFYAALGFEIVKRIRLAIGGNKFPSVLMRKPI